jgi:DNA-binding transcriptional regulator YhcF (GntR family)
MSNRAITWAYEQKCGSMAAKSVLVKLADNANDDGICFPSMDYIARHCECDRSTVKRIIKKLEQLRLVDRYPRSRSGLKTANEYRLRFENSTKSDESKRHHVKSSTKSDGSLWPFDGSLTTSTMGQALTHEPLRRTQEYAARAKPSLHPPHGTQKKKESSAPPGLPGFKETVAVYHDLFIAKFGAKPDIDGRDGKLLSGLVRAHGADEVQGLLRFFFEHPPDWVEKKGKFTVYTFKGVYTELLAQSRNRKVRMGVL